MLPGPTLQSGLAGPGGCGPRWPSLLSLGQEWWGGGHTASVGLTVTDAVRAEIRPKQAEVPTLGFNPSLPSGFTVRCTAQGGPGRKAGPRLALQRVASSAGLCLQADEGR